MKPSPRKQTGRPVVAQPKSLSRPSSYHAQYQPSATRATVARPHNPSAGKTLVRRQGDWTMWDEARIKVYGLTPIVTTQDLWKAFSSKGTLFKIELYEDSRGARDGKALLLFRPPPREAFWLIDKYAVYTKTGWLFVELSLERGERKLQVPSPVRPGIHYPQNMVLNAESIDFGLMHNTSTMLSLHHIAGKSSEQQLHLDLARKDLRIEFKLETMDVKEGKKIRHHETFRLTVPLSELHTIYRAEVGPSLAALIVNLDFPPRYYRKIAAEESHDEASKVWYEDDAWYRQTEILNNASKVKHRPTSLRKYEPLIDLGRWTTYRLTFDLNTINTCLVERIGMALQDFNVNVEDLARLEISPEVRRAGWDFIDRPIQSRGRSALEALMEDSVPPLSFPVRYQLEVCLSHNLLNEYSLTEEFATRLRALDTLDAQDMLEYVANQNKHFYDPDDIFTIKVAKGIAFRRPIPSYSTYVRSATVTPTTMYFHTPSIETSNRVIRQFSEHADRFLRVRFMDEKWRGGIYPTPKDTMNEVFTRVKRTMRNGIDIGDRHYEFLAFGNSQFRQHGAYFFAPLPNLSCNQIRNWMGMFREIKEVARFSARIGQCLSTTRPIHGTKVKLVEIPDIERNGYVFSDGVGKLSNFVAQVAANELGLVEPPSAFQFRLGGCKGVLTVAPDVGFREIHIRRSQYKFPAKHEGLEIIRCSQFISIKLNRQLISVLTALGVPDTIFTQKLDAQLASLQKAMTNREIALAMLQKNIDHNQTSLVLAGMVIDGFQQTLEPFMMSLLHLWRAWSIQYLKEKAHISIDQGALLLGCIDESATLQGHFDSGPSQKPSLPQIFVQVCRDINDKPRVMKGTMLLARNPSLHPGDIRVVQGVDVPALHHLKNVVVLPQTGDRDIASMCSGGDLDGDDFLVIWDQDLLPREWNYPPMDYRAPESLRLDRDVNMDDITSFFVNYMKNDTLPSIALAHVAWADEMHDGVKSEKCLRLASLHSKAVDYFKTGQAAVMSNDLRPKRWPHFMEKQRDNVYISRKILGKLYDQVERVDFQPAIGLPFDSRILTAYSLDPAQIKLASELKKHYDRDLLRIMAQHEISTEFEVWSTFVLHHSNEHKDFKFHEIIGELSTALKDRHRQRCYEAVGSKDFAVMGPFVAAMYQLTAETLENFMENRQGTPPLMSFPWLFPTILGKIATGSLHQSTQIEASNVERVQGPAKKAPMQTKEVGRAAPIDDTLETAEGEFTHRGEILELFEDLLDLNDEKGNDNHNHMSGNFPSGAQATMNGAESVASSKPPSSAAPMTVDELLSIDEHHKTETCMVEIDADTRTASAAMHGTKIDKAGNKGGNFHTDDEEADDEKREWEKEEEEEEGEEEEEEVIILPVEQKPYMDRLMRFKEED